MTTIDELREFEFKNGIYVIDTRSFRITNWTELPERLYILCSDPLTYEELIKFLSIVLDSKGNYSKRWTSEISEGVWPLKYIFVIRAEEDKYYILNRYYKRINWKKILTV